MSMERTSVMLSAMNNNEYYNGLTMFKRQTVSVYSQNVFWKNEVTVMGGVENKENAEDNIFVKIVINLDTERIMNAYCSKCQAKGALCRHGVAVSLAWMEYERKRQPHEIRTNVHLLRLMDKYEEYTDSLFQNKEATDIHILPVLYETSDSHGYQVEFKIGREKYYIIKDIYKFAHSIKAKETVEYGKHLSFVHQESAFANDSVELLQFIMNQTYSSNVWGDDRAYGFGEKKRVLLIHTYNAEYFFPCCHGKIVLSQEGCTREISILERNPPMRLLLQPHTDDGIKVSWSEAYRLVADGNRIYLFYGDAIYHCDRAFSDKIRPLFYVLQSSDKEEDKKTLLLHKNDLRAFMGKVVQQIKNYISVEALDFSLEDYQPIPLETHFYIDVEEGGLLFLRCEFHYKDAVFYPEETQKQKTTDENAFAIVRDSVGEREALRCIFDYFIYDQETGRFLIEDEDLLYHFIETGMDRLLSIGTVFATDAVKKMHIKPLPKVTVGVSLQGDLLQMQLDAEGLSRQELYEILEQYRLKKRYYRIKSGEFISFKEEEDSLQRMHDLFSGTGIKPSEIKKASISMSKYRAFYIRQLLQANDAVQNSLQFLPHENFTKWMDCLEKEKTMGAEVPETLHGKLREYQLQGFRWLYTLQAHGLGGILADEMGLGKTIQLITLLLAHKKQEPNLTSLIICPASLVYNWKNEVNRFAPDLSVAMIVGDAQERAGIIEHYSDYNVLITSYDLLRRDMQAYHDCYFTYEILDEAQFIKNQSTKNAHAAKAICAKTRFALTGTPIENRLSELWSIFDFLMPGYLFSYAHFKASIENPIIKEQEEAAYRRLRQMIAPFVLRRKKKDVLEDLPEKLEDVIYAQMTGEQKRLYAAVSTRLLLQLKETSELAYQHQKIKILAELMRLRQICCDPGLAYQDYHEKNAKLETCMELVREAIEGGHKLLLFSQFTTMLDVIAKELSAEHIAYYMLTGQTSKEERMRLVEQFQNASQNVPVFLISLKAGGTGLNLTSADVVIHYDPWWNLAVQNQATDRTHRIGQTNVVSVHKIIMKDTIEERILHLQNKKFKLAEDVLDSEHAGLGALSREELLELLQG